MEGLRDALEQVVRRYRPLNGSAALGDVTPAREWALVQVADDATSWVTLWDSAEAACGHASLGTGGRPALLVHLPTRRAFQPAISVSFDAERPEPLLSAD